MSEAFSIRRALPEDYEEVGEITLRGYVHDGFLEPSDAYAEELRDAADRALQAELWVAVDAVTDRLLGSVTFCPLGSVYRELAAESEGEFRMLAVDPQARGRGVARALVQLCLARSRELGFADVVLCSLPTMTAAHALYLSLGFVREPALDWWPRPEVELWGFRKTAACAAQRTCGGSGSISAIRPPGRHLRDFTGTRRAGGSDEQDRSQAARPPEEEGEPRQAPQHMMRARAAEPAVSQSRRTVRELRWSRPAGSRSAPAGS